MADELYETDAREQKAWRRVVAASRKLARQLDNTELGEAVANSYHQDTPTRDMRRSEALAALLEAAAANEGSGSSTETDTATTGRARTRATRAESSE